MNASGAALFFYSLHMYCKHSYIARQPLTSNAALSSQNQPDISLVAEPCHRTIAQSGVTPAPVHGCISKPQTLNPNKT